MHPDFPAPPRPRPRARTPRPLPALKATLTTALAAAVAVGPLGAVPASAAPAPVTPAVAAPAAVAATYPTATGTSTAADTAASAGPVTAAVAPSGTTATGTTPTGATPTGTITATTPRDQLTFEDHGFPGYFSELSIVEDAVPTTADHFTVQADFCLHPEALTEDRLGFDIVWDIPISDWEPLLGLGEIYTSRVPVTDGQGRTAMVATMVVDTSGPVDENDWSWELKTAVDLAPVEDVAPDGGCGTLELPVAAPLMLSEVAAAQPEAPVEEFDPYAYPVQFIDPEGRRSMDEVRVEPHELPRYEAWAESILDFTGSTTWFLMSPVGPADPAQGLPTVTLRDDTLCDEPYEAAILDANSLQPLNFEPDLDVSCTDGVKTFTLQSRLRADRQLVIAQHDPRPGPRPASAELTADFTLNGATVSRTASVTSATSSGRLTGPWQAPELCAAEPFADNEPGSTYYREVRWMQCWGVTQGYASDHTYRKSRSITRGESVTFLFRYAMSGPALPVGSGGMGGDFGYVVPEPFWDVDESGAFAEAIYWAAETGVTQGYQDGSFRPYRPVTRGQLAAFVYRAVHGAFEDDDAPVATPFDDVPAGHPFDTEIAWLAEQEVVGGYTDGTFRPDRQITRGEVARVLYQVHDQVVRR